MDFRVQFVNQTQSTLKACGFMQAHREQRHREISIGAGESTVVQSRYNEFFMFANSANQPMVIKSAAEPNLNRYFLDMVRCRGHLRGGPYFITAPVEARSLKDLCTDLVVASVNRSVAKIAQLPLSTVLIEQLKDAAEHPSDYLRAKKLLEALALPD